MRFFNRITLQTPESVELEFVLAGIGNRAFALLIDYTLLGLVLLAFAIVWGLFSTQLLEYLERAGTDYSGLPNWLAAVWLLVNAAIFVGYFVYFETLWQGQTPGKRFARIRVIRDDGRSVKMAQATLRALLRPIDDILSLGVFFIIFSKREKRIGDWIAGTLVVQEERPMASASFAISESAPEVAKQLLDRADVSQLMPDDFAIIREYLQRRGGMEAKARSQLSLQLARQVKRAISLEQLPADMTPDLFLEAVYLAYQQNPA